MNVYDDIRSSLNELSDYAQGKPTNVTVHQGVKSLQCTLMHKRTPVVDVDIDLDIGLIVRVGAVHAAEHLPIGVQMRHGAVERSSFNDWWAERSIPASRSGVREALETMGLRDTRTLLLRCLGLSLSDQYWVLPNGSRLTWDQVNFFDHPFSDDIGDVLFGADREANAINFSSPDNTSDGNLKKRWKIIDGKRCLIKGGSNPFRQQPLNEVIAADIMERLNIPHIAYSVLWNQGAPYSVCKDFVTADTELVPAYRIYQTAQKLNHVSVYQHFVSCAESLGIPNVIPFLDRMITLDYLIANEDRHLNNFGALRNAETLEWIGMAPIFDNGSSLGYDRLAAEIWNGYSIPCKPFKRSHEEQLALVTSFSWINYNSLSDIRPYIVSTLTSDGAEALIGLDRAKAIADATVRRIHHLHRYAEQVHLDRDSTQGDVMYNVAERYQ